MKTHIKNSLVYCLLTVMSWMMFDTGADKFRLSMTDKYILNPRKAESMQNMVPAWLSKQEYSKNSTGDKRRSVWKPTVVTVAVGGTIYLIFAVRSK